jgi:hypothetical protein
LGKAEVAVLEHPAPALIQAVTPNMAIDAGNSAGLLRHDDDR